MYQKIRTAELDFYITRPIANSLVEQLKAEFEQKGYYDLSPLVVVVDEGKNLVLCGNHRLKAAMGAGVDELPCNVIEADKDEWIKIAIRDNEVNKTLRHDDLFDWLYRIKMLKAEGLTQSAIGERIGWSSKQHVNFYNSILDKVSTDILNLACEYQESRVDKKSTSVYFDFTEGWFRNSGIYDLNPANQTLPCLVVFTDSIVSVIENIQISICGEMNKTFKPCLAFTDSLHRRRNCDTQLLDLACEYQESRVSINDTNVSFDFTEGWFRNSGIYDLNPANQTLPCLY